MIIKSQPVNAKSDLLNTIVDKIYNLIFGYLDSLFDDANYEKEEQTIPKSQAKPGNDYVDAKGQKINPEDYDNEDNPAEYTTEVEVTGDGRALHFLPIEVEGKETPDEFTVEATPVDVYGTPMVWIKVTNNTTGKTSKDYLVHEDDQQEFKDAVDAGHKEVSASCKIGLSKVVSSTGTAVRLTNISSSYDIPLVEQDVECILSDPEFVESLPEGDSVYRVDSYDDGLDINALDNFKFENSMYIDALDCSCKTLSRIAELKWFAHGLDYRNFQNMCEPLIYDIQYQIQELAKLCIIHNAEVAYQVASSSDITAIVDKWQSLKECVEGYISCLQLLSMSVPQGDEKVMIDNWIRQLNDAILYQYRCLHPDTCC